MTQASVRIFYSYCRADEALRTELSKHLSFLRHEGLISDWHDRDIHAGDDWDGRIQKQLSEADIILILISADYLASAYCYSREMTLALERDQSGAATVIPILLRPVDWEATPFARFRALPSDGRAVTAWKDRDEALAAVAHGIRATIRRIQKRKFRRSSLLQRVKQALWPPERQVLTSDSGPQRSKGYIRVRIDCPTCGHAVYTTFIYAGAQYRCPACRCVETVPNELPLFGRALAQGKISRDTQVQVLRRKLARQDLTITAALLCIEDRRPAEPLKELSDSDIVRSYMPPADGEVDENILVQAYRSGASAQIEQNLAEALRPGAEYAHDEIVQDVVPAERIAASAEQVADALMEMALEDMHKSQSPADVGAEGSPDRSERRDESFSHARVLWIYSAGDETFADRLRMHSAALSEDGPVDSVDSMMTELAPKDIGARSSAFHIVGLLVSPAMLASQFWRGNVAQLLELHRLREVMLIPVIVHPAAWQKMAISKLQVLPADGRPLSTWQSLDEGCAHVVDSLRGVIAQLPAELIVKVAERGDEDAKFKLAISYLLGQGVNRNGDKAIYWMNRAADESNNPNFCYLAGMMQQGQDPAKAIRFVERAAAGGHVGAMAQLGSWYEKGIAVPRSTEDAFRWYLQAAEHGHCIGMMELARCLFEGIGVSRDDARATSWLTRAAESGSAMAMLHLGNSYYLGRGVAADETRALEWWNKAAATGDEAALLALRAQKAPITAP